jgi:pre-mRNA-splicing factor SYF2
MASVASARVHPACINAGNPYHECSEYCFRRIADGRVAGREGDASAADSSRQEDAGLPTAFGRGPAEPRIQHKGTSRVPQAGGEDDKAGVRQSQEDAEPDRSTPADEPGPVDPAAYDAMTPKQKKLFDLRLKLNAARKANQLAIVAEKKREDAPEEPRGVSKQKWFEEKKRKIGKQLEANGLDMSKAYMLDTQEDAEAKYKKWEKKPAPFGWDVFNQRSLYNAYKKRTKNVEISFEDYVKAREADPDFYRDGASLEYGKQVEIPEENINRMVQELESRGKSRKEFSRRRKFHDERDIDSINDRNEHFNRKIERAFGKYTVEIKNNLERGTALPD